MNEDLTAREIDELELIAASCARDTMRCLPLADAMRAEHAAARRAIRESTTRLRFARPEDDGHG